MTKRGAVNTSVHGDLKTTQLHHRTRLYLWGTQNKPHPNSGGHSQAPSTESQPAKLNGKLDASAPTPQLPRPQHADGLHSRLSTSEVCISHLQQQSVLKYKSFYFTTCCSLSPLSDAVLNFNPRVCLGAEEAAHWFRTCVCPVPHCWGRAPRPRQEGGWVPRSLWGQFRCCEIKPVLSVLV